MRESMDWAKVIGGFLVFVGILGVIYTSYRYLGIGDAGFYYTSSSWEYASNWRKVNAIFFNLLPYAVACAGGAIFQIGNVIERVSMEESEGAVSRERDRKTESRAPSAGSADIYCPQCGSHVGPEAEFCPDCGSELA